MAQDSLSPKTLLTFFFLLQMPILWKIKTLSTLGVILE